MGVWTSITTEPLDLPLLLSRVTAPGSGAVVLFVGNVRDIHEGRPVRAMTYDAHVSLAERVLRAIADEVAATLERGSIAVEHRIGRLRVGETSVAIVVGSPHRDAAYAASRMVIEEIKKRLPIWKQEHYVDGDSEWLPGHSLR